MQDDALRSRRVAVVGLDCVPPEIVFERWRGQLPNLRRLMNEACWGPLRSCHPPITVPAWTSMVTGVDPGQLGVYGFRNRLSYAYGDFGLTHARTSQQPRVWDVASRASKNVILLGVPQTYPPPEVNGVAVSCFLTPKGGAYTYPRDLQSEIEAVVPDYVLDVDGYRNPDKRALFERICDKTRKQFYVARHLLQTRPWDFFMMVEMGPDRLHHVFWQDADEPKAADTSDDRGTSPMLEYYRLLDAEVGSVLKLIGDDATILVVSDHGAKDMRGGIAINDWLQAAGYLRLHDVPDRPTPLRAEMVDWDRTTAWGEGGYCGRIFVNVRGREPKGIVDADQYEIVRSKIISEIAALCGPDGSGLESVAHRPQSLYAETRGIAPDLLVYFGDLAWRAIGSTGHKSIYLSGNDTGPDGANHDWDGIFVLRNEMGQGTTGRIDGCDILDVAPTILHHLGLRVPAEMRGRVIGAASGAVAGARDRMALGSDAVGSC